MIIYCLLFFTISATLNQLALQISSRGRVRNDGYEFMWVANDVWSQMAMNISFSRWRGKNLSALADLGSKWEIPETHVIRSSTYKGGNEVATLPGFRYDALTTLGLFQTIGVLAQVRGLAGNVQAKLLQLLREVFGYWDWPDGLSLLPGVTLSVSDGMTSMKEWLLTLPKSEKNLIKTRQDFFRRFVSKTRDKKLVECQPRTNQII